MRLAAPDPTPLVTMEVLLPWLCDLLTYSASRMEVFVLKKFMFEVDSLSFVLPVLDLFLFAPTWAEIMALAPV